MLGLDRPESFRSVGSRARLDSVSSPPREAENGHFPRGLSIQVTPFRGAALREALEEAGLHGTLVGPRVGTFQQTKWGTEYTVEMYLMDVSQVDETWDEQDVRQRRWCSGDAALVLLKGHPVVELFHTAIERLRGKEPRVADARRPMT